MLLRYLRSLRVHRDADEPLPYVDPLRAGRHPFQIFLLALCVVSSAPYLVGAATAEAVENQLPVLLALAWGLSLFVGSTVALAGSLWHGSFDVALTMERLGLSITGFAGIIYGLCILASRDPYAPFFALLIFAGFLAVRIQLPEHWRESRCGDVLSVLGVLFMISGLLLVLMSPGGNVLASVCIITGFGISCLSRARDIARIFTRAREIRSVPVLREGEEA